MSHKREQGKVDARHKPVSLVGAAQLTKDGLGRIERVMAEVLDNPAEVSDFEYDFAMDFAGKVGKYGLRTLVSPKQWKVIEDIEEKFEQGDYADG